MKIGHCAHRMLLLSKGSRVHGDLVLDPFGGSGTALIAAEKTGRSARLIECDGAYCDTILHRFKHVTASKLSAPGEMLEDVKERRGDITDYLRQIERRAGFGVRRLLQPAQVRPIR